MPDRYITLSTMDAASVIHISEESSNLAYYFYQTTDTEVHF